MIPLSAHGKARGVFVEPTLGRITSVPVSEDQRHDYVLRIEAPASGQDLAGYVAVLWTSDGAHADSTESRPFVWGVDTSHLADGDIVSVDRTGHVRTLYRKNSPHNAIFATDRCNSFCLMCSQPPRDVDDRWRIREHLRLIELIDPDCRELGITGGEPTLLGDGLVEIVRACKTRLPNTSLHILSNGRLFRDPAFTEGFAEICHPDLMIGIPLYSDLDSEHDYIVQANGAFNETILGLLNLGRCGIPVEIRVVIHRLTYERLPRLAEFIYRNLTFAAHVPLMGLEPMGLAVPNLGLLWIDPGDYQAQLEEATLFLADRGMNVSIYNHQLCTVPATVWEYCRRSISDWKNEYLSCCDGCSVREQCAGLFTASLQRKCSAHISPIPNHNAIESSAFHAAEGSA